MDELHRWGFAEPGPLRDGLTALALAGAKTTTSSLALEYEVDGAALPVTGQVELLIDSEQRPVAVVETISVRVVRLADVDDQHATDEGEGYANAAAFREAHERYRRSSGAVDRIRAFLADPSWDLDDDTLVVAERFRIVERLDDGGTTGR